MKKINKKESKKMLKNWVYGFAPLHFDGHRANILSDEVLEVMRKKVSSESTKMAAIRELEKFYKSLVSMTDAGITEIVTPLGSWTYKKEQEK